VRVIGLTAVVAGVRALVGLPISFWAGFSRERSWGFSTQGLAGWLIDFVKGFGVGLLLTAAALTVLVGSARLFPSMWPLVAAAAGAAMVLTLGFAAPVVIEPLFNRFTPLDDVELAAQLQAVAERADVPVKTVLVSDASRRTRKTNAYVSGLGRTRRLVLYDTLVAQASPAELSLVVAHELGHRRARHLVKGTLLGMVGLAAFIAIFWALLCSPGLAQRAPAEQRTCGARPVRLRAVATPASPDLSRPPQSRVTGSFDPRLDFPIGGRIANICMSYREPPVGLTRTAVSRVCNCVVIELTDG
jgi:STE24 endopeptidase